MSGLGKWEGSAIKNASQKWWLAHFAGKQAMLEYLYSAFTYLYVLGQALLYGEYEELAKRALCSLKC